MAELKPANSRQQTNTEILMDCETELKVLIRQAVFSVVVMADFQNRKRKIIKEAIDQIQDDEELKAVAEKSLNEFADREYRRFVANLGLGNMPLIVAFVGLSNAINKRAVQTELSEKIKAIDISTANMAFGYLGNSQAKVQGKQSLYGKAELNARFLEQQNMVEELRQKTNLVVASTHSDCSDRCSQWQGKVYSLDGTYGKTDDGRDYQPLEVATNAIFKGHRNGLLGYNCRHKLYEYKTGLKPVKVSSSERKREKELSAQQRLYERKIREYKSRTAVTKDDMVGLNSRTKKQLQVQYKKYRDKARELTAEYEQFCRDNNRVIYRSRIKI